MPSLLFVVSLTGWTLVVLEAPPLAMTSKPMISFSDNEGSAMNSLSW